MSKQLLSFNDHYHLAPIKYQWAWNRFQDSLKNHWIPQEIPMGNDKACFEQNLTEDERETFLNVFATLTTSDLCIQENIAENTYKIIGAPEVKIYLSRQIAEEAIHCFDETTEILTPNGWLLFSELTKDTKIAQYHEDGSITWTKPKEIISSKYAGPMVNFKSNDCHEENSKRDLKYNFKVTPNHRCVRRNLRRNRLEIVEAEDCSYRNHHLIVAGYLKSEEGARKFTTLDKLQIAFQADGSYTNKGFNNGAKTGHLMYLFGFKREDKIERMLQIVAELDVRYTITCLKSGHTNFYIWLPLSVPLYKHFDWVDLEKVDSNYLSEFIDELQFWDGTPRVNGSICYTSTNQSCAEAVELFATLCGRRAGTYDLVYETELSNRNTCYQVHITQKDFASGRTFNTNIVSYSGKVYCVTVPTGMVVVRSNGSAFVSGNSLSYQHVIEILSLPDEIYTLYEREEAVGNKFRYANDMGQLIQKEDVKSLFKGLFFYYMCFEGIWFYGGFSPIFAIQRRNLMRQTGEQLQYIMKDESQHIAFGVNLLTELSKETNFKLSQREVEKLSMEAILIEEAYAKKCIHTYIGYSPEIHIQQTKFLADRRLRQLGYAPLFNVENPIPWLDEQVNIKKEKNFFEQKIIEYQSIGLLDFEENYNPQDIANWNKLP